MEYRRVNARFKPWIQYQKTFANEGHCNVTLTTTEIAAAYLFY